MNCPKCKFKARVLDSRVIGPVIRRYRRCQGCGNKFTTEERHVTVKQDHEYPRTRKEAKTNRERFYFTGKRCKSGHMAKRYTFSYDCVECSKETQRNLNNKVDILV